MSIPSSSLTAKFRIDDDVEIWKQVQRAKNRPPPVLLGEDEDTPIEAPRQPAVTTEEQFLRNALRELIDALGQPCVLCRVEIGHRDGCAGQVAERRLRLRQA